MSSRCLGHNIPTYKKCVQIQFAKKKKDKEKENWQIEARPGYRETPHSSALNNKLVFSPQVLGQERQTPWNFLRREAFVMLMVIPTALRRLRDGS